MVIINYQLSAIIILILKGEIDLEIVIKLCNYSAEKMKSEVSFVLWSQHACSVDAPLPLCMEGHSYKGRGKDYYTC